MPWHCQARTPCHCPLCLLCQQALCSRPLQRGHVGGCHASASITIRGWSMQSLLTVTTHVVIAALYCIISFSTSLPDVAGYVLLVEAFYCTYFVIDKRIVVLPNMFYRCNTFVFSTCKGDFLHSLLWVLGLDFWASILQIHCYVELLWLWYLCITTEGYTVTPWYVKVLALEVIFGSVCCQLTALTFTVLTHLLPM